MSTILKKIGELLGLKEPEQAAMAEMTGMEQMTRMMTEMEQQEHPSNDMGAVPGELAPMTGMEPQEHSPNDMAATPSEGEMEMTPMQPEERQKRGQGADR